MALNTFDSLLQDSAGNTVAVYSAGPDVGQPIRLYVFTDPNRINAVTTLYAMDGTTVLPGYVTPTDDPGTVDHGRVHFKASDAYAALWLWDGNPASTPWLVWARETPAAVTAALGAVGDAQAAAAAAGEARDEAVAAAADGTAALGVANAAAAEAAQASTDVAGLDAAVEQILETALTIDESEKTFGYPVWQEGTTVVVALTANATMSVWPVTYACRVEAARFSFEFFTIAANDTNYWELDIARVRAGVTTRIAVKNTKVTGGEGITARTPWAFAGIPFDSAAGLLAPGDLLVVRAGKVGAPANFRLPIAGAIKVTPT